MLPENYQETIAAEIKKLYLGDKSKNKPCFKVQKYIPQAMSSSTLLFGDNHFVPVQVTTTEGKLRNFVVTIEGYRGYLHALVKDNYVPGFYLIYKWEKLNQIDYRKLTPAHRYRAPTVSEYYQLMQQIRTSTEVSYESSLGKRLREPFGLISEKGRTTYFLDMKMPVYQDQRCMILTVTLSCAIYGPLDPSSVYTKRKITASMSATLTTNSPEKLVTGKKGRSLRKNAKVI